MGGDQGLHFLGVGAQRAATTWLARSLRAHPQIWMPPRKELHYFSRDAKYPSATVLSEPRTARQAAATFASRRWAGGRMRRDVGSAIGRRSISELRWFWNYYVSDPNDGWYRSLFDGAGSAVRGEVTPDYAMLDLGDVARVRRAIPGARIIFTMRHPVERIWSQVRLEAARGLVDLANSKEIIRFVDSPAVRLRSDYGRTISNWREVFGAEAVHICTVDEVSEDPRLALSRIGVHLGIDGDRFDPPMPVNQARRREIEPVVERHIAHWARPMLRGLASQLDDPTVILRWTLDCERILDS